MKKLLKLSLAFTLTIVSFGAIAQDDTHSVGSVHTFKVNVSDPSGDHTGNTYTWAVYHNDEVIGDPGTPATAASGTTEYNFVGDFTGTDIKTAQIQWLKAGDYLVELSEVNKTGGCSTLRRVNILVTAGDLDLIVLATDVTGVTQTAGALTSCNDMSGKIIPNADPSDFGKSVRYFTVNMTTDGQDWIAGLWGFEYSTSVVSTVTAVTFADPDVVDTDVTFGVNTVDVALGKAKILLKVETANTPGPSPANDITLNLVASNAFITTAGGNTNEDVTTNGTNNTPESFVITASPKTSVITIE